MNVRNSIHNASIQVGEGLDTLGDGIMRVGRGTAAGFFGGLIASWMMNQYQTLEKQGVKARREQQRLAYAGAETHQPARELSPVQAEASNGNEPTVEAAEQVSRKLFDHELSPVEKKVAGPTVHYGYGALVGALYGGLSELIPSVSIGLGIPYATMLWLGGSETAVPALGLAKPPTEVPVEDHATAMATHFVYGMTLDISRRILRRLL